MLEETTINKLIEMRFTAMADAFRSYRTDPKMRELPPEDFFGMLVDAEYTSRKNNRLKRLIRNAELEQRTACIADIDYASGRKLNKTLIKSLATCEYITEGRNIFITGATGSGKTYLACAFGMEALKQYFSVKFVRLPDMLLALETAREEKNYPKVLSRFIRPALLIIDEWLLMKVRPVVKVPKHGSPARPSFPRRYRQASGGQKNFGSDYTRCFKLTSLKNEWLN